MTEQNGDRVFVPNHLLYQSITYVLRRQTLQLFIVFWTVRKTLKSLNALAIFHSAVGPDDYSTNTVESYRLLGCTICLWSWYCHYVTSWYCHMFSQLHSFSHLHICNVVYLWRRISAQNFEHSFHLIMQNIFLTSECTVMLLRLCVFVCYNSMLLWKRKWRATVSQYEALDHPGYIHMRTIKAQ